MAGRQRRSLMDIIGDGDYRVGLGHNRDIDGSTRYGLGESDVVYIHNLKQQLDEVRSELISLSCETDIKQQLLALAEREKERDLKMKKFMVLMAHSLHLVKIADLNPVEQEIIVPEGPLEEADWGTDNSAIKSLPAEEDKNEEAVNGSQEEDEEQEAANSSLGEGEETVVMKSLQEEEEKKDVKKMKFEGMRIVIDSLEREGIADQEMESAIISLYRLSSFLSNLENQRALMVNLLDILGRRGIANDEMEIVLMELAELLDREMLVVIPRLLDGNGIQLNQ